MSTYTPIASISLSASASSVTFSGIPQTYTDLVCVISGKEDVATGAGYGYVLGMQYNSDTGSNYSVTRLDGNGSSASSDRFTNQTSFDIGYYGGTGYTGFSTSIIQIMNYSNSTTYKTGLIRDGWADLWTRANVNLWKSTSAITTISFHTTNTNFEVGTNVTIYGIKAA